MGGEIDDKPIEPVQVSLSLFGEKGDQRNQKSLTSDLENEKDMDMEDRRNKDLANCKQQLEAKEAAYKQALLMVDHYQKMADELFTLLKQSDNERGKYIEECTDARTHINELESKIKEMADSRIGGEQLSCLLSELKAAQEVLVSMETELAAARDLQLKAMEQAELMESASAMEKKISNMLSRHMSELNEAILMSKLVVMEAHNEKCKILSEKDAEIEVAKARAARAEEQLEDVMKGQMEMMQELEIQLLEKSILSDLLLQLEVEQSMEMLNSSDDQSGKEAKQQRKDENGDCVSVMVSAEEYDLLIKKAAKADDDHTSMAMVEYPLQHEHNKHELETMKKNLELAMGKIRELRNRAEQAVTRADAAEEAKSRLEDQIKRCQEDKHKKKAALVALKEVSAAAPQPQNLLADEKIPATYLPLGKVLDMKF